MGARRFTAIMAAFSPVFLIPVLGALCFAAGTGASCQTTPPAQSATASPGEPLSSPDDALAWDRDFDLLLELKKSPTKAQGDAAVRRDALLKERDALQAGLADYRFRLTAVEGTYTTEAILNEMLRQSVGDMDIARENLRGWIKRDEARTKEIDALLKRLARSQTS